MSRTGIKRERLLVAAALICLSLLVLDRLVFTPLINGWNQRAEEIDKLRLELAKGGATVDQEARWLRWRDEMGARLLPANPSEAESALLNRVDAWAREAGLTVSSLRPRWKDAADKTQQLELQVAGTGSMQAVAGFVYRLEASPLAIAVDQLAIAPTRQGGTDLGIEVRITGLSQISSFGGAR